MNEVNIGDKILIGYLNNNNNNIEDINHLHLLISEINDINIEGNFVNQYMPEIVVSKIIWCSIYFFNNLNNKHM